MCNNPPAQAFHDIHTEAITMPCFLVEMLVDNCAEVVEDTQDLGLTSTLFSLVACPTLTSIPTCTNTSVTPAGLSIN